MKNSLKRFFPICFLADQQLLLYRYGKLILWDHRISELRVVGVLPLGIIEKFWAKIPLIHRLFRLGIRTGMQISENIILLSIGKRICEFDLLTGKISEGFITERGSRPLKFSKIDGIDGFDDMVVFGEYAGNSEKLPVAVYRRAGSDKWEKIFVFPQGEIEHIHNVVPDKARQCVWILTGDMEDAAAIWQVRNNFKEIELIKRGKQIFRSCVAFATEEGLLYITDTPFAENSVRLLYQENSGEWISRKIQDINGSSIYGCIWNKKIVFSTTVEGDGRSMSIFTKLFGRKRGQGIKNEYSYVYCGEVNNGFEPLYKVKKDIYPFIVFQFGVLMFPEGDNHTDLLPVYHVATVKNDLSTIIIRKNSL